MSLKLVELQVALPKTFDAGKVADQQQQQSALTQSQLAALAEKELLKKRASVNEFDESEKTKLGEHSADDEGENSSDPPKSQAQKTQITQSSPHPFKGHRVDFTG